MNNENRREYINGILQALPNGPGVYQFFNSQGIIIYVGKAKSLKKRVSSYFHSLNQENAKVRLMVAKIDDLKTIVVETESDALLLENNLIKKYQPKYNILLKDDKSFPWICIKSEPFPRVYSTRNLIRDGSLYFGPYTSVMMVRTLLEMIRQLFQLRTCSLPLSEQSIANGKFKVCLEYHMGNCKGPCVGEHNLEDYEQSITQVKEILRGNIHQVQVYLKGLMTTYADNFEFEQAEIVRKKIENLEKYQSKSTIVSPTITNVDVFTLVEDKNIAVVNFLKVMNGAIIQAHTMEVVKRLDEDKEELLPLVIADIRERFKSVSREIIVSFPIEYEMSGVSVSVPKIGDKRKLLELSERNAKYYLVDRNRQMEKSSPEARLSRILETMKSDLHMAELPVYIECFDNSNIQGTHPVAACVVFKNARPAKADYTHFNIKTVEGANDFSTMEEVVYRRYKRLLDENRPIPQLIVVDGGKGQLHSAVNVLRKLDLYGKVAIIGIAKRLEEIYFPGDQVPLYLDKQSETLKVIQQIRNEAHRFGITHHRDKRSKSMAVSVLDNIPGVGPKTIELLYNKYSTISAIKGLTVEELTEVVGKKKGEILRQYLDGLSS
jgi:excinuclease ABC subunit C